MLNVLFWTQSVDVSEYEENTSGYFNGFFEKEWLADPIVQQMIMDIDNTTVNENLTLDSPVLGGIVPSQLSTGVKTLILLHKTDLKVDGCRLGDNCWEWVFKIAENKEIFMCLDWRPPFPDGHDIRMLNTGEIVHGIDGFIVAYTDLRIADPFDDFEDYWDGEE